jgi:hypothetical protein
MRPPDSKKFERKKLFKLSFRRSSRKKCRYGLLLKAFVSLVSLLICIRIERFCRSTSEAATKSNADLAHYPEFGSR